MKELHSIGETAKLMGISVQMLRNYSNMNLLQPQYIDADSGYRYYSFKQFHYIDRIKYLRKLGLSLEEISEILKSPTLDKMLHCLEMQKKSIEEKIQNLQEMYDDVNWYLDYFQYINKYNMDNIPYILHLDRRYAMVVNYQEDDTVETVETRLARLKNSHDLKYRRQYGYIADFSHLIQKQFTPQQYYIYLKEKPAHSADWLKEFPSGTYLCFRGRVRTENWDPSLVLAYFHNRPIPPYVIADEYEDNLSEYHSCPYEVQLLIQNGEISETS